MQKKINLTYEILIGLLQGKEIHLVQGEDHIVIAPPFDGIFLTREQIQEIQYSSEERVWKMLNKVLEASQETHSFFAGGLTTDAPDLRRVEKRFCEHGYNGICPECDATQTPPAHGQSPMPM